MAPLLLRSRPTPGASIDFGSAFVRVCTTAEGRIVEVRTQVPGDTQPMIGGFVNDPEVAGALLTSVLGQAEVHVGRRTRLVVSIPASATPVQQAGLVWAVRSAGVRCAPVLIDEPVAAAIGLGLDIGNDSPQMIVDIGHGITEAAIISSGTIVALEARRVGCDAIWQAVDTVVPGAAAALSCRDLVESAFAGHNDNEVGAAIRTAVKPILNSLAGAVRSVIVRAPVDVAVRIRDMYLVGGGSFLGCVVAHLERVSGLHARLSPERMHAVVAGDLRCARKAATGFGGFA